MRTGHGHFPGLLCATKSTAMVVALLDASLQLISWANGLIATGVVENGEIWIFCWFVSQYFEEFLRNQVLHTATG